MTTYYGFQGTFTALPGRGNALADILLAAADGLRANDACVLYIISRSPAGPDEILVTEVWTSKAAHDESLQAEDVQATIQRARPLIAGVAGSEFYPVGGNGL